MSEGAAALPLIVQADGALDEYDRAGGKPDPPVRYGGRLEECRHIKGGLLPAGRGFADMIPIFPQVAV